VWVCDRTESIRHGFGPKYCKDVRTADRDGRRFVNLSYHPGSIIPHSAFSVEKTHSP
jgi:hypothetical protein